MGRPSLDNARTENVTIKTSAKIKELLDKHADDLGVTPSEAGHNILQTYFNHNGNFKSKKQKAKHHAK
jgi:hypothetical protein